jgi:hypothetical protein
MTKIPGWWQFANFPNNGYEEVVCTDWARNALVEVALAFGGTAQSDYYGGKLKIPFEEMIAKIQPFGGRLFYKTETHHVYAWPDGLLEVSPYMISFATTDQKLFEEFQKFKELYPTQVEETDVEVIVESYGGYNTQRINVEPTPLEEGNYSKSVVDAYRHVVADLESDTPCGRIIIMNGPPGSGKTYIVRSLLKAVKNGHTLIVPASLVEQLDGPKFMQLLLTKRSATIGPMLLVIEDADTALSKRLSNNMSALSTLLNLSDGIIGGLLDLRIVATTNSSTVEFDPAVLRPGRLCKHIEVNTLSGLEALSVLQRLLTDSLLLHKMTVPEYQKFASKPRTLAEVYQVAREVGWKPKA